MIPPDTPVRFSLSDLVRGIDDEFRSGSLQADYFGIPMQITGQITVASASLRLSFESRMSMDMDYLSSRLDGIVSLPDNNSEARMYLANFSDHDLHVTASGAG